MHPSVPTKLDLTADRAEDRVTLAGQFRRTQSHARARGAWARQLRFDPPRGHGKMERKMHSDRSFAWRRPVATLKRRIHAVYACSVRKL